MAFSIDPIINWCKGHWYFFLIAFGVYFAYTRWFSKPAKMKPIDRAKIEKEEFIKRNELNKTTYKTLYRANRVLGNILTLRNTDLSEIKEGKKEFKPKPKANIEENPEEKLTPEDAQPQIEPEPEEKNIIEEKPAYEIVYRPMLFSLFGINIINIFTKGNCIIIDAKTTEKDENGKWLDISKNASFDMIWGIFYDRIFEIEIEKFIKYNSVFRTDLQHLAGIYYAHSQEQSTFDPNYAHDMAMKEKELQIELAKKRGKMTSI